MFHFWLPNALFSLEYQLNNLHSFSTDSPGPVGKLKTWNWATKEQRQKCDPFRFSGLVLSGFPRLAECRPLHLSTLTLLRQFHSFVRHVNLWMNAARRRPVRWMRCRENMIWEPHDTFLEIASQHLRFGGASDTMSPLCRRRQSYWLAGASDRFSLGGSRTA